MLHEYKIINLRTKSSQGVVTPRTDDEEGAASMDQNKETKQRERELMTIIREKEYRAAQMDLIKTLRPSAKPKNQNWKNETRL